MTSSVIIQMYWIWCQVFIPISPIIQHFTQVTKQQGPQHQKGTSSVLRYHHLKQQGDCFLALTSIKPPISLLVDQKHLGQPLSFFFHFGFDSIRAHFGAHQHQQWHCICPETLFLPQWGRVIAFNKQKQTWLPSL